MNINLTSKEVLLIRRALAFRSELESDYGRNPTPTSKALDNLEDKLFTIQKSVERHRDKKRI